MKSNILLVLSFVPLLLFGQEKQKIEKIDAIVEDYFEKDKFYGTALVAENGKILYEKGVGFANLEWDIPNEPDVKFRLGSITKQFTATIIMQLVEEKKIKLDGKISDYLPDYRKDIGEKVTIHQLLNHTSGIPSYTDNPKFFGEISRDFYRPSKFVKEYCSGDLKFEPGTKFRYNNSGYFLLGYIIETIEKSSYEKALKKRIFEPLEMNDTGYDTWSPILKKRATGYQRYGKDLIHAPYLDMSLPYAAGSIYSTVGDLFKWDQALNGTEVLSKKSKKLMFTPTLEEYGYGWMIKDFEKPNGKTTKVVMHGGGINGFHTLIIRFVEDNKLIVLLNNTGRGDLNNLSKDIAKIIYQ